YVRARRRRQGDQLGRIRAAVGGPRVGRVHPARALRRGGPARSRRLRQAAGDAAVPAWISLAAESRGPACRDRADPRERRRGTWLPRLPRLRRRGRTAFLAAAAVSIVVGVRGPRGRWSTISGA